jgi:hypothetical protein
MYFRVTFAELFGRQLGCVALASILAAVSPIGALTTTTASAADYRMEKGPEAIPAGLTKEVSSQIAPSSLSRHQPKNLPYLALQGVGTQGVFPHWRRQLSFRAWPIDGRRPVRTKARRFP